MCGYDAFLGPTCTGFLPQKLPSCFVDQALRLVLIEISIPLPQITIFYNHLFVIVFVAFIVIYLITLFITPGVMTQSLLRPLLFKLAVKALCWVMSQCCLFVQVY